MKLRALAAAALVVTAVPLAMHEAGGQTPAAGTPKEKRYCTISSTIGTRLGATRRCRTRSERAIEEAETRAAITHGQTTKHYTDQMKDMRALCPGSGSRFC